MEATLKGNVPNPGLQPERGDNYGARFEWYLKNAGVVTVGGFMRNITDLHATLSEIPAAELGLEADYPGFSFTTVSNAAGATRVYGYELEYSQQLTALPGALRGLGVFANFTATKSDNVLFEFGNPPRSGSAGVTYRLGKFNASIRGTWVDDVKVSATRYMRERTITGIVAGYQLTANVKIFINGRDVFSSPRAIFRTNTKVPGLLEDYSRSGAIWVLGLSGMW